MSLVTTPHINADKDAFAKTVLMPGDPLRSKFIARKFSRKCGFGQQYQGHTGIHRNV